nr:MAG TPA: 30S ribosomal protein S11 [Caudoviricetes sp.]
MDTIDYSILSGERTEEPIFCPYCGKVVAKVMKKNGSIISLKCKRCSKVVTLKI